MTTFKVESGMQMLARLTKKPDIENFHPRLFKSGPNQGHTIEIYSDDDVSCLLCDIICESLMPREFGGKEAGIILVNTDGTLCFDILVNHIEKKLQSRLNDSSLLDGFLQKTLSNLFIFETFNITQLHATIHHLGSFLINQPNICLVMFNSLTAFYWSEQCFKIMKMDMYTKDLLRLIQNVVKDYKVTILYTRPGYFSSSKEHLENLNSCCEKPTLGHLNYRIHMVYSDDETHYATVRTFNDYYKSPFKLIADNIVWL